MNDKDFEEMRNQIAILKEKLSNESIVNDKMMRNVLNTKVDNLRRKKWIEWICAIFVICMGPISFRHSIGCSWEFLIFTDLMMVFCILGTQYIYGPVTKKDLMAGNLLEVSKLMSKFKKQMKVWIVYIGFPLIAVWYAFLVWELYHSPQLAGHQEYIKGMTIATSIGLVIGAAIGIRMALSAVNTANDIIKQIEE